MQQHTRENFSGAASTLTHLYIDLLEKSFSLKKIAMLAVYAGTLAACGGDSKNELGFDENIPKQYNLPNSPALSSAEKIKYAGDCQIWYDSILANTHFNGGILIAKNGQVVYEKYEGTAHLNSKDIINSNTPFHIASVSKTFTAMAVLKLWQDNRINLDSNFAAYFHEFNYPGVTIRSLLNHRSGLPNYVYFMDKLGWDKSQHVTNKDVLDYLIKRKSEFDNIGKPNAHFSYCNTNYALLALLIEKITETNYAAYLKKIFFDPLGMNNSFVYSTADSSRITPSHDWRGQAIPLNHLDFVFGDKNIYSTPQDLLKWDRLLSSNQLFKPATLEEAYKPYSNENPGIKNYGLGWRMNIYPDGKKIIFHNGWWHGNNACFIRLINEDATLIVLGNRYNRGIYKAKYLANIFGNTYTNHEEEQ